MSEIRDEVTGLGDRPIVPPAPSPQGDGHPGDAPRDLLTRLGAAHKELVEAVHRQWDGKYALKLSIPARPDHDSDLIIGSALREARVALEQLRADFDQLLANHDALAVKLLAAEARARVPHAGEPT